MPREAFTQPYLIYFLRPFGLWFGRSSLHNHSLALVTTDLRDDCLLFLSSLRSLSTVLGTTLQAICDTGGIERTTDDVITTTRKILYTTTAYEHD